MSKWDQYPPLKGQWLWVSASQITKFLSCPRMWWWEYRLERDKRKKPPKTKALEIGVQHSTELEEYLKGERSKDGLMPLAQKGVHLLPPPGSKILVEHPFHIDIHRSKAPFPVPESFDGVRIIGAIDLIDLNAVGEGWIYIDDHKTCKNLKWAKKPDMLQSDIQLNLYGFWASRVAPVLKQLPGGMQIRLGWINYPKSDDEAHRVNGVMKRSSNVDVITEKVFPAITGMLDFAAAQEQDEVKANSEICKTHFGGCWHGMTARHCNRGREGKPDGGTPFESLFEDSEDSAPSGEVNNFESGEGFEPDLHDPLPPEGREAFERTLNGGGGEKTFRVDDLDDAPDDPEYEGAPEGFEDRPLDTLGLPTRAFNRLKDRGVEWASELLSYTRQQLLDMKGLGAKSVDETMEIIAELREQAKQAQDNPVVQNDLAEQVAEQAEQAEQAEPEPVVEPEQVVEPEPTKRQKPSYTLCVDCVPLGQTYTDLDRFFEACCMVYEVANAVRPEATPYKKGLAEVREFAQAVLAGNNPESLRLLGPVPKDLLTIQKTVVLRSHSEADRVIGGMFRVHAGLTIQGTR